MATSSKHDHKNVGCHRINPPPRSGDRVLATTRTPAEIYKHRKETFARKDERDALKAAPMMFSARSEAGKQPSHRCLSASGNGSLPDGPPKMVRKSNRQSKGVLDLRQKRGPRLIDSHAPLVLRQVLDVRERKLAGVVVPPDPMRVLIPNL